MFQLFFSNIKFRLIIIYNVLKHTKTCNGNCFYNCNHNFNCKRANRFIKIIINKY